MIEATDLSELPGSRMNMYPSNKRNIKDYFDVSRSECIQHCNSDETCNGIQYYHNNVCRNVDYDIADPNFKRTRNSPMRFYPKSGFERKSIPNSTVVEDKTPSQLTGYEKRCETPGSKSGCDDDSYTGDCTWSNWGNMQGVSYKKTDRGAPVCRPKVHASKCFQNNECGQGRYCERDGLNAYGNCTQNK